MHYRNYCWLAGCFLLFVFVAELVMAPASTAHSSSAPTPQVLGVSTALFRGDDRGVVQPKQVSPVLENQVTYDDVTAKSFLAYDAVTGVVLAERGSDKELPIASLTKLMTAWLVYKHNLLSEQITIAQPSKVTVKPVLGLRAGETVRIEDLFYAMLVGSTNDVADTLASYVQLKENTNFVDLMNDEAGRLGMNHTHFANPIGFDSEENYSTAADIRILVDTVLPFTAFNLYAKSGAYDVVTNFGTHHVRATHTLAQQDKEIYAVKTGYTQEARGNMVSRAIHDNHEIVLVVIGSSQREVDTQVLKNKLFGAYVWR